MLSGRSICHFSLLRPRQDVVVVATAVADAEERKYMSNNKNDIEDPIEIHIVSTGVAEMGWIHTHGMDKYGCPDLEIRGVPLFLMEPAAGLLNHIADYIIEQQRAGKNPVKLGHTMAVSRRTALKFVKLDPIAGSENHFREERWALSDEPMRGACIDCGEEHSDETHDHATDTDEDVEVVDIRDLN